MFKTLLMLCMAAVGLMLLPASDEDAARSSVSVIKAQTTCYPMMGAYGASCSGSMMASSCSGGYSAPMSSCGMSSGYSAPTYSYGDCSGGGGGYSSMPMSYGSSYYPNYPTGYVPPGPTYSMPSYSAPMYYSSPSYYGGGGGSRMYCTPQGCFSY